MLKKVEDQKAADGYEGERVGGLTLYQYPHSHLTDFQRRPEVMPLHHGFVTLERDSHVESNCPSRTPER